MGVLHDELNVKSVVYKTQKVKSHSECHSFNKWVCVWIWNSDQWNSSERWKIMQSTFHWTKLVHESSINVCNLKFWVSAPNNRLKSNSDSMSDGGLLFEPAYKATADGSAEQNKYHSVLWYTFWIHRWFLSWIE